ncbi:MAG: TonB-dependent receptor [Pseudomonadota bacterium]
MSLQRLCRLPAVLTTILSLGSTASVAAEDVVIDEIVVTADFRERSAADVPASITIFDAEAVEELAIQHFEELVNTVPNLNWSGDGHRARYFQIRGVGELEQYQGAPNPSVGFLIDDIDFSGIGTIATLFDVERVEVLRGPQGSRYGANALAGLIYMRSTAPTEELNGLLRLSAGDDNMFAGGLAFGGALSDDGRARYRVSGHHHSSDGFRDNPFLGRADTNGRDETTVRGRFQFEQSDTFDINVALLYTDVDNGYDAFALDNGFRTLSDKPGRDAQQSLGGSLRLDWSDLAGHSLTSITSFADSDIVYGFDADWGNDGSWAPVTYDFISLSDRARRTVSQEFRLTSDRESPVDYLLGIYALELDDSLSTLNQGEYFDPGFGGEPDILDARFDSEYQARNVAVFGQLGVDLSAATYFEFGLRVERRTTDYRDSDGLSADPSETMVGGELSLRHEYSEVLSTYVSLSRGYKAGGFNLGVGIPDEQREFNAEALWNAELGIRSTWLDNRLSVNAAVFANRRDDQQVRASFQLDPGDPTTFVFLTGNAATGDSLGLEADVRWLPSDTLEFYANVGLLDATFDEYQAPQGDLSGRDQAHAPNYTLAAGGAWRHPSGFFARVDATARDAFYFDVSHDQRSEAYTLTNLRIGYEADRWSTELWVRNAFDETYAVRGFFFGNEPPDFPNTLYTRLGDPRQLGITFDTRF